MRAVADQEEDKERGRKTKIRLETSADTRVKEQKGEGQDVDGKEMHQVIDPRRGPTKQNREAATTAFLSSDAGRSGGHRKQQEHGRT